MRKKTPNYLLKAGIVAIAAIFLANILCASGTGLTGTESVLTKEKATSNKIISNFAEKLIIVYFKVREYPDGSWHTSSITANIGTELEFELKVKSTRLLGHYFVFVIVDLPTIGGDPMFDYVEGSASNPGSLLGANDEEVVWCYAHIGPATPKVMSFRAIIAKPGSETVDLTVFSLIPNTTDDPSTDSLQVTGINNLPNTPTQPSGPTSGYTGESYDYSTSSTDPDGDDVYYWFDWGDGNNSGWLGPYDSGDTCTESYSWSSPGNYDVKAKAKDVYDVESGWSDPLIVEISTHPPGVPSQPSGPTSGYICIAYDYSTSSTDPDGDDVSYGWDWEDGSPIEWSDWYSSGETCTMSHVWEEPGTYEVRVKAKDIHDAESDWSIPLNVTIENHPPNTPSNPDPPDGATGIDGNADLSWSGGDPDPCDTVMYDVYFEANDPTPDVLVSENQSETTYDPGTMNYLTTYYWQIVAWDNHGASASGPIWEFTTETNYPPVISNPDPPDEAVNVSVSLSELCVLIEDPEGDCFDWSIETSLDIGSDSATCEYNGIKCCNVSGLEFDTTYTWYVNATDSVTGETTEEVYTFTTEVNNPPNQPSTPYGPTYLEVDEEGTYCTSAIDPDDDQVRYRFDWDAEGSHEYSDWSDFVDSGDEVCMDHSWSSPDTYVVKAQAEDEHGTTSDWSNGLTVDVGNQPPDTPSTPYGPTSLKVCESGEYCTNATDPDGDMVQYRFDWDAAGSHNYSDWTELVGSGETSCLSHAWGIDGTYVVKTQARDEHGEMSDWSNGLSVEVVAGTGGSAIFYFDDYDPAEAWMFNPERMANHNLGNYALTFDEEVEHLTSNNYTGGGCPGTIVKVELRTYGKYALYQGIVVLRPVFNGENDGDNHNFALPHVPNWSEWFDISDDTNAPSTWTWSDIKNLDCDVESKEPDPPCHFFVYTVEIRVTYGNQRPDEPTITGPTSGYRYTSYIYSASATDPDGDQVRYKFDWGDGTQSDWTNWVNPGQSALKSHYWSNSDTYCIKAKAQDEHDAESDWSVCYDVTIQNRAPNKPSKPSGPTNGQVNVEYTYTTSTTDPDDDQIYYWFDWGDGTNSGWLGPYDSGATTDASHTWTEKGTYSIRVKAKDIYNYESEWSYPLDVTMPKNKPYNFNLNLLGLLFERFPNAFPILRQLLGL